MTAAGAEPARQPGPAGPVFAPPGSGGPAGVPLPGAGGPAGVPLPGAGGPAGVPPAGSGLPPPGVAPPPPRGPGVTPPFAAPPTDRSRRTLWISLVVGALALVLCGGGGLFGLGVIAVSSSDQLKQQAQDVVGNYLDALHNEDYPRAYALLCSAERARVPIDDFSATYQDGPKLLRYELGTVEIANDIIVPAKVSYDNGLTRIERYGLVQDRRSAQLRICRRTG